MRAHRGFSLLETLVALAVAALLFGALLPAMTTNLERMETDASRAEALIVAQSRIELYSVLATDSEGRFEGRDGAFHWTATIDSPPPRADQAGAGSPFALRRVRVEVFQASPQNQERALPIVLLERYRVGVIR